jgi:hypothetical protein
MHYFVRVLIAVFITLVLGTNAQCRDKQTMSFDSPGVLNLSRYLQHNPVVKTSPAIMDTFHVGFGVSELIMRAREYSWDGPAIMKYSKNYTREDEKKLISHETKAVRRSGNILVIQPEAAPAITFKDWFLSGEGKGDDDQETFFYMGKIGSAGYHRIEVRYMHDSPSSFLINPKNGKTIYVDNGGDTVAISPNGDRLLVFNDGYNPPFGLVVANITASPIVELHCRCRYNPKSTVIIPVFKGWHRGKYIGFDMVLTLQQQTPKITYQAIPIQFSLEGDGWHISSTNIGDVDQVIGLSCGQ